MKVILPFPISENLITSIDVPETDHAIWDALTTYARGNHVISVATHTVYRSLSDVNLDNDPDLEQAALADPLIDDPNPVFWQVMGATNRWRLFDQKPSQPCIQSDSISFQIEPGRFIGGIAGFGISAETVRVEVFDGLNSIYDRTLDMRDETAVQDWTTYFTAPFIELPEFVFDDLPVYGTPRIVATISNDGNNVSVGQIILGDTWRMGKTVIEGSGFSGLDFSYVQTDEFGNLTTVRREAARLSEFSVWVQNDVLFSISEKLRGLRGGVPAVWIGGPASAAAINYGFYRSFDVPYRTEKISLLTLEIQGIV